MIEPLQYEFFLRALLTSIIIAITSSFISPFLISKRWSLLGDAISHAVLPGIAIAYILKIPFFIGAVTSAIITAIFVGFIENKTKVKGDTALGIGLSGAFALGIAIMSIIRTKDIDLYHILFGNVLAIRNSDVILVSVIAFIIIVSILALYKGFVLWTFNNTLFKLYGFPDELFRYFLIILISISVVSAVVAVGIVLAVALLIIPGAIGYLIFKRISDIIKFGAFISIISVVLGLYSSYYLNVSSGPAIVIILTIFFIITMFISPKDGIITRIIRTYKRKKQIEWQDKIKLLYELSENGLSIENIKGIKIFEFVKLGIIEIDKGKIKFTPKGKELAQRLIIAHELWESYLKSHNVAEKLEHYSDEEIIKILNDILKSKD
ncbi:MAG: metal ABC transporter permease [candidate division WOR-3 bacterium]